MQKNNLFLPAIILCVICLITTGLLALTYNATQDARDAQAAAAANANRQMLYPTAASFSDMNGASGKDLPEGLREAYIVKDNTGMIIGHLFVAEYAGYSGPVPVMIAIGTNGTFNGIKILDNDETPGLGKKVGNQAFFGQFSGKAVRKQDFTVKPKESDRTRIDAVAGATISSNAVTQAVNIAIQYYRINVPEVTT